MRRVRGAYERRRVLTPVADDGITRQSFAEECDINKIVDTFTRTGMVNHIPRVKPVYGECPEQNLFEAACVQAAIRSSEEDAALTPPESPVEAETAETEGDPEGRPETEPTEALRESIDSQTASDGES